MGGKTLRPYQEKLTNEVFLEWENGNRAVLIELSTGAGKTVILTEVVKRFKGYACVIAHRDVIVEQLSNALASEGIYHAIVADERTVKDIGVVHREKFGREYIDPNALTFVASVDTLIRRKDKPEYRFLFNRVDLLVFDEAHHVVDGNKWVKASRIFPEAKVLQVTATPERPDKKGLGRKDGAGITDVMIHGPSMRWLMDHGYLCDYTLVSPESHLDLDHVPISKTTGDFVEGKLKKVMASSEIVGDMVGSYLKFARGKQGLSFLTSIDLAEKVAAQYEANGIRAEAVSSKSKSSFRRDAIKAFRKGELQQLTNVDLFGEGFDVPGVEVVSMGRPTHSLPIYLQQVGRAFRVMQGKKEGIIIDQVGNWIRHGLPDIKRYFSLASPVKGQRKPPTPQSRECLNPQCLKVYLKKFWACPRCGWEPEIVSRDDPKSVEGNLVALSPEALQEIRDKLNGVYKPEEEIMKELQAKRAPLIGVLAGVKRHRKRKEASSELASLIDLWAGWKKLEGETKENSYRLFYHAYGVDVLTAQTLKEKEIRVLMDRISSDLPESWTHAQEY